MLQQPWGKPPETLLKSPCKETCGEGQALVAWRRPDFVGDHGCGYLVQTCVLARQSGSATAFPQHRQERQNTRPAISDRFLKIIIQTEVLLIKRGAAELYSPRQKPSYPYPTTDNAALCSPKWMCRQRSCVWIHRGFVQLERSLCLDLAINFAVICLQCNSSAAERSSGGLCLKYTAEDVSGMYTAGLSRMDWFWCARCFFSDSRFLSSSSRYTEIKEGLTQALFQPSLFPPRQTHTLSTKSLNHALFPELQDCELHIGPLQLHSATVF